MNLDWPKAELHCHLDGAVRPATARELADGLGIRRPLRLTSPPSCSSQAEFIACFADALMVMQTEAALERTARELCEDSLADGIDYLEVRWAPRLHLQDGLSPAAVIEAVLRGLAAAPPGIRAVAIACAMRSHAPEDNVELARVAGRYAGRGMVGFDLAGDEAAFPTPPHARAFEAARAAGLRLTCHAGEAGPPSNVGDALDLGVERVAHGVIGARDPAIVERVRELGVALDMAPTSNVKTRSVASYEEHPLPRLVRAGVRCTISTDSRTVAGTTMAREFELAATVMGLTETELRACDRVAREARFDS